jgi:hypothetical protein
MPPKDAADSIRANPIFADLPAKELEALAAAARDTSYRAREYVFTEGEPAVAFCLVNHAGATAEQRRRPASQARVPEEP